MGLETATYVQDLVLTNPVSGDLVQQGDDHFRMLKTVMKNTLPTASRPIYNSAISAKTASFTIVVADENKIFTVDATAGAVVATLPTLAVGDAGWACFFLKLDSVGLFHIAPTAGNLYSGAASVARARRCIPGTKFSAAWTGANWFVERVAREPIGTLLPFGAATLPAGYEWPYGQTLASFAANYPEYVALVHGGGIVPDMRGRAPFGRTDMGGVNNGLLPVTGGTSLGAMGGAESLTFLQAYLPAVNFTVTIAAFNATCSGTVGGADRSLDHTHSYSYFPDNGTPPNRADGVAGAEVQNPGDNSAQNTGTSSLGGMDHLHGFTGGALAVNSYTMYAASGGSGTAVPKMPPAIVLNFILVVE